VNLTRNGNKPTYVLGTGLSHDGSACLLKDGQVIVAVEKERITRLKHDGMNDSAAILYCLDIAGIGMNEIDLVVQNANFSMLTASRNWFHGPRILSDRVPVVTISHHLAHAYSSIGTCPFDEAAVLVIDGCGNSLDDCIDLDGAILTEKPPDELSPLYFEKDSYYIFSSGRMQPRHKDFSPWGIWIKEKPMCPNTTRHSIGGLYLAASIYVFSGMEDPGKLMGLAPYGRPGVYDFPIFDLRDGRAFVRYDWMDQFRKPCRNYEQFKADFQYYADIAWWVQREVERAILYVLWARYETAPHTNLCYSGGVALNAVANRGILTEGPFERVYFQPAAGDNGLALGCAYYGWLEVLKRERVMHNGSTFFGACYNDSKIDEALSTRGVSTLLHESQDFIRETAHLLAAGKIVAWFQGGAEFGPRALGNRSILADPRRAEVRDFINREIKQREDFRPFAPSVLAEEASIYFDCTYESPYMILVAPVRPEWREVIPSVVHLDHSARIQTVTEAMNPGYHRLLQEFKKLTGIGVLLNTSLNKRKMPIVETPEQAIDLFLNSALDALVIDGRILLKAPASDAEQKSMARISEPVLKSA
jgi:carbamoyltransferase